MRLSAFLVPALLLAPAAAAQTGTLDQSSPMATSLFNVDSANLVWQQQIRAGTDGVLEGVRVEVRSSVAASVAVRIRIGPTWASSAAAWSGTLQASGLGMTWESVFLDCSAAGIALAAGDDYVLELVGAIPGMLVRGNYCATAGIPQYPYPTYLNQSPYSSCYRIGFDTYMLPLVPALTVSGGCPGPAQITLKRMTPFGPVVLGSSTSIGAGSVPVGPCAGALIDLLNPTARWNGTADANGEAILPVTSLPAAACGAVHVQGFDVASCRPTNPVLL